MERWARRQKAIQSLGARVTWETWRFQGLWQSPSVEAAWWLDICPELNDEEALDRVAARLYGPAAAPLVRQAWRLFSEAWDPSHPRYGTYWIGPMVMGPAHPYDLGGAFYSHDAYSPLFYQVFPGKRETDADKALENPWLAAPRFQLFPSRWPVERARDYGHMARFWAQGMASLRLAFEHAPPELRPQAQADLDMAEMVGLYIEEDLAFNEFTRLRDGLYHMSLSDPVYRTNVEAMAALLDKALARADSALRIVRRTPFVGWGFTYGVRVSAAMIEEKIQKTRALLAAVRARLEDGEALLV